MYTPHYRSTPHRQTFTLASAAAAATIPVIALSILVAPVPTLGLLAGIAAYLLTHR